MVKTEIRQVKKRIKKQLMLPGFKNNRNPRRVERKCDRKKRTIIKKSSRAALSSEAEEKHGKKKEANRRRGEGVREKEERKRGSLGGRER